MAGINSKVIFNSNSSESKQIKRRLFLKELGLALISEHLVERQDNSRLPKELKEKFTAAAKKRKLQTEPETSASKKNTAVGRRCICPRSKDRKSRLLCSVCQRWVCMEHSELICIPCKTSASDSD